MSLAKYRYIRHNLHSNLHNSEIARAKHSIYTQRPKCQMLPIFGECVSGIYDLEL